MLVDLIELFLSISPLDFTYENRRENSPYILANYGCLGIFCWQYEGIYYVLY